MVDNLTALNRTKKELHTCEARYRALFENMVSGYALSDVLPNEQGMPCDFRFLEVNQAFEQILGLKRADVVGRTLLEVVPKTEQSWIDRFRQVVLTGQTTTFEEYSRHFDRFFEVIAFTPEHGRVAVIFRDVTDSKRLQECKRVEQLALEQLKLAEASFANSVSALVVLDRDYNFLRVNEAYARFCQRTVSEFVGRNHFDMYPSDTKAIFDEVVRTKQSFSTLARPFVFADQPERGVTYWDWTLVPVLDESGEIKHLVFSLMEVTERKRAEEALRCNIDQLERTEAQLKEAKAALTAEVKALLGILPICAYCKNIRNDKNYWQQVEEYLSQHADVRFTHGICPKCLERVTRELSDDENQGKD